MAEKGQENGAYQLIKPPNILKAKVGATGVDGIDPELIKRAEGVVDTMSAEFADSVSLEITELMQLAMDLEDDPSTAELVLKKARRIRHDLRGQGATYSYDLISDVASSLFRYTECISSFTKLNPDVLRAHADAMRAVIKNQVKGDGGEIGIDLVKSLESLVGRMSG